MPGAAKWLIAKTQLGEIWLTVRKSRAFCVSRLGRGEAKRLFLLADAVSGEELLRMGYLYGLVTSDALDPHVKRWAVQLASNALLAFQERREPDSSAC